MANEDYEVVNPKSYLDDYFKLAINPGQGSIMDKMKQESLLKSMMENASSPFGGGGAEGDAGVGPEYGDADVDFMGGLLHSWGTKKLPLDLIKGSAEKGLLKKFAPKVVAKAGVKLGLRGVPYVGWGMMGLDALDAAMEEGKGPYDLFGLAPNNPIANWMTWNQRTPDENMITEAYTE